MKVQRRPSMQSLPQHDQLQGHGEKNTKAGDVAVLTEVLRKLLADEPSRRRMGAASLAIIQNWSYEQCRIGILAALTKIVQK